ncbi:hypothetical protein [Streptomyces fragilis]|uniref:LPXTG cell wall anchor domain-containing protein n=1 Tax=Streptomyces fragilis TaxID=67301 RepID=A0ABV2YFH1_9ACTN|nr:hypothetical protein [Streptomyces fragilis]
MPPALVPPDVADAGPSGDQAAARTGSGTRSTAPLGVGLILTGLALALTFQALRLRQS